ncbi:MAG: phosphorylase [Burkholderiales bacterium]|nr:phosphorylase [Burkholderiales bacterium]
MTELRPTRLRPGTLAAAVDRVRAAALASGALQPIETEQERIEDGGVRFVVRRVSSLALKRLEGHRRAARAAAGAPSNPFLPPEPGLLVADVSDTHCAVLNKFYVLDGHLLIVTRAYVDQETLLDESDFAALAACMAEMPSLGFYNGGVVAGASQPHKHLQMVPLPLAPEGPAVPIEPVLAPVAGAAGIVRVPAFGFPHAFAWRESAPAAVAEPTRLAALYRALLEAIGVRAVERGDVPSQSAPYSLLVAGRWMLAVPRAREHFGAISINALGFAGSLFVRDADDLAALRRVGPMAALREVAGR